MQFISMDRIGPVDLSIHSYALTVICMLTGYIKTEVGKVFVYKVYAKYRVYSKILSYNGLEFKTNNL